MGISGIQSWKDITGKESEMNQKMMKKYDLDTHKHCNVDKNKRKRRKTAINMKYGVSEFLVIAHWFFFIIVIIFAIIIASIWFKERLDRLFVYLRYRITASK